MAARPACDYSAAINTAVTTESDSMVATEYPFYLVVKRANCSLEVQTVGTKPGKEVEVGI